MKIQQVVLIQSIINKRILIKLKIQHVILTLQIVNKIVIIKLKILNSIQVIKTIVFFIQNNYNNVTNNSSMEKRYIH